MGFNTRHIWRWISRCSYSRHILPNGYPSLPSTSPHLVCTDAIRACHPQAVVPSVTNCQSPPPFNVCLVSCFYLTPSVSLAAPSLEVLETVFFLLASWGAIPLRLTTRSIIRKNSHPCGIQVDTPALFSRSLFSLFLSIRFRDSFGLLRHQVRGFHHRSFRHLLFPVTYSLRNILLFCIYLLVCLTPLLLNPVIRSPFMRGKRTRTTMDPGRSFYLVHSNPFTPSRLGSATLHYLSAIAYNVIPPQRNFFPRGFFLLPLLTRRIYFDIVMMQPLCPPADRSRICTLQS